MKALIVSLESFQKGTVPEELTEYIDSNNGDVLIVLDESSKIKTTNPCKDSKKSKRTQAILSLNTTGQRAILTGTFMSKSPVNAYDQMNFLRKGFFPESMFAFAEHYTVRRTLNAVRGARVLLNDRDYMAIRRSLMKCRGTAELSGKMDSIQAFYGVSRECCAHIMRNERYTPFRNLDELWGRIGKTCLKVERNTAEVPPLVYRTYNVSLTAEQRKLYMEMQNLHCTDKATVGNGLELYLRFQDICNGYEPESLEDTIDSDGKVHHHTRLNSLKVNPKLDMLDDIMEDMGDKQVVIWCSRTKLLYDAEERLRGQGCTTAIYDGKIGREEREQGYGLFSEGKVQAMLVNQRAGAYGLDKLQNADYAIYLCNDYSVEYREQSVKRIYRGEIKRSKYIMDITCGGTCEDRVVQALRVGRELLGTGTTDTSLFTYSPDSTKGLDIVF